MVYIKRVERNKRKYVTAVSGLEAHGMDLKKVAKEFGKKCKQLLLRFDRVVIFGWFLRMEKENKGGRWIS